MLLAVEQCYTIQHNAALVRFLNAGDAAQRHTFTGARGTEETEYAVMGFKRNIQLKGTEIFSDIYREAH